MAALCGTKQTAATDLVLISDKIEKCDICKVKKKIVLEYGFSVCEDCLLICTNILEQLQSDAHNSKTNSEVQA